MCFITKSWDKTNKKEWRIEYVPRLNSPFFNFYGA